MFSNQSYYLNKLIFKLSLNFVVDLNLKRKNAKKKKEKKTIALHKKFRMKML